mmetsp:Transcript_57640/g.65774  ORF Transcript_57640/g.65774 Transcript_57640/m.65774 type:complete len:401 (+) Transcript_57640:317-1519(+)
MSFFFKKNARKKAPEVKAKEVVVSYEEKYNLLNHYLKELQKENTELKGALNDQRETSRKNKVLLDEFLNNVPTLDPDLDKLKDNIEAIHQKVDLQSQVLETGFQTKPTTGRHSTGGAATSETRSTNDMTPTRSHHSMGDHQKDGDSLNEFHMKQDELLTHIANMREELTNLQSVQKTLGSESGQMDQEGNEEERDENQHESNENEENNEEDGDDDDEEEEEKITEAIEELCRQAEDNDNVLFFVDSKQQMWQLIKRPDISLPGQEENGDSAESSQNEGIEIKMGDIALGNGHKESHHPGASNHQHNEEGDKELEDDSLFAQENENSSDYVNTEPASDEEVSGRAESYVADLEGQKENLGRSHHRHHHHHHHHLDADSERIGKDQSLTNNTLSFSTSVHDQ